MKRSYHLVSLFGIFVLAAAPAVFAADVILIKNAQIVTGNKLTSADSTNILIQDQLIKAIGEEIATPDDALVIEAKGKIVTPGFFNAQTQLGIEEIGAVASTADYSSDNQRITASLRAIDALNPSSVLIPHNRSLGLTHSLVQPVSGAGLFAGMASVIQLSKTNMIVKTDAAMVLYLGEHGSELAGGSRAAALAILREAIEDAIDYQANKDSYNRGNRRDYNLSRHDLAALGDVVSAKTPLLVHVDRAGDIQRILSFAEQYNLKLILSGVTEGWRVAENIAKQKVPVILDPIYNLPSTYERLGSRLDNAKIMNEAGVTLMFTGMGWQNTHNAFLVRQSAGNAVANGLPYDVAIQAMTSNPAKVFKLNGYADLRVGSDATLVLWSGDPLEVMSAVEAVLIKGKSYKLQSRSTRLRDRYWGKYRTKGNQTK